MYGYNKKTAQTFEIYVGVLIVYLIYKKHSISIYLMNFKWRAAADIMESKLDKPIIESCHLSLLDHQKQ